MTFHVKVRNFQSIAEAEVAVDGFTVITGSNNTGKTALMRAIRGVFTNPKGTAFVRHGEPFSSVDLQFDDAHVIWEKGSKGVNRYVVNGLKLDKVGQAVPDEVAALGVRSFEAGGHTLWPQIAQQFVGQVFLTDKTGAVLAEAIADVDRVGRLNKAMKLCESDRRSAQSDIKLRREDVQRLEKELGEFDGLDDAVGLVEKAEVTADRLRAIKTAVTGATAIRDKLRFAEETVEKLTPVELASEKLPTKDNIKVAIDTLKDLEAAVSSKDKIQRAQKEVDFYETVPPVSRPNGVTKLRDLLDQMQILQQMASGLVGADETVKTLEQGLADKLQEKEAFDDEFREFLAAYDECPLCGAATHG